MVRDTPNPTRSAGAVVVVRSTGNTRPVPSAATPQQSCARMSGAKKLSAERPPAPGACARSKMYRGDSRTDSEKTPSRRNVSGQPLRHEREREPYVAAALACCFTYLRIFSLCCPHHFLRTHRIHDSCHASSRSWGLSETLTFIWRVSLYDSDHGYEPGWCFDACVFSDRICVNRECFEPSDSRF